MDAPPIFTPEFLATDPEHAHRRIAADGYWICEKGLDRAFAASLDKDLDARPLALNVNDVGPVRFRHQTCFTHALAGSRAFFDLVTNAHLRRICRAHLGPDFRLKCQRYYQNARRHALTWHTDDKSYEGELQVLRGSHKWSATSGKTALQSVGTLALRKLAAPPWRAMRATWRMVKRS